MDNMGNKLEECDKILAAMKDSGLKDRVAAVQELLTRNASLIKEIKANQELVQRAGEKADKSITTRNSLLLEELNLNLTEIVRLYQELEEKK